MKYKSLSERCRINTNIDTDTFVGINATKGDITVNFPLGYNLSMDEEGLRRDIILLMSILSKYSDKRESKINTEQTLDDVNFPIQAYLFLISDYFSRGYYKERDYQFCTAKKGRIDWNRTVKTQRAFVENDGAFYLNFVVKKQNYNEDEIITLIHECCVYESFLRIGWLFSNFIPEKPKLSLYRQKLYYASIINKKLVNTFNDKNKRLFKSMLAVINCLGDEGSANNFRYGTHRFEYVWESMIDDAFGIPEKERYFPKTRWIISKKHYMNSSLEPDTIMLADGAVFVIDAKYYKYGSTGIPSHLPESTSINKQITYGEFIAESPSFKDLNGNAPVVYNAFLMPYDSQGRTFPTHTAFHYIGSALSDWKSSDGTKPYEEVAGILLDVKSLMANTSHYDARIVELAKLIEASVGNSGR